MERIRPLSKKKRLKVTLLLNAGNFVQKIILPEHKHLRLYVYVATTLI